MNRSTGLTAREGTAYECDHMRQVARNVTTGEWHHVDGGVIGQSCTSHPYKVAVCIEGDHSLVDLVPNEA